MRPSGSRKGFLRLMALPVSVEAGYEGYDSVSGEQFTTDRVLTGAVWSPAPLDMLDREFLRRHAAADHETVWAVLDDGRVWYLLVNVHTGRAIEGWPTPHRAVA